MWTSEHKTHTNVDCRTKHKTVGVVCLDKNEAVWPQLKSNAGHRLTHRRSFVPFLSGKRHTPFGGTPFAQPENSR